MGLDYISAVRVLGAGSDTLIHLRDIGDHMSDRYVRADHPFAPIGTSYFEVKIIELREPKKPIQGSVGSYHLHHSHSFNIFW